MLSRDIYKIAKILHNVEIWDSWLFCAPRIDAMRRAYIDCELRAKYVPCVSARR